MNLQRLAAFVILLLLLVQVLDALTSKEKAAKKKLAEKKKAAKAKAKEKDKTPAKKPDAKKPAAKPKPKKTTPSVSIKTDRGKPPAFIGFKAITLHLHGIDGVRPGQDNVRREEKYIEQQVATATGGNKDQISNVDLDMAKRTLTIIAADGVIDKLLDKFDEGSFHLSTQVGAPLTPRDITLSKPDGYQEILMQIEPLVKVGAGTKTLTFEGNHFKQQIIEQLKIKDKNQIQHVVVWPNRREISVLVDRSIAEYFIRHAFSSSFFLQSTSGHGVHIISVPAKPQPTRDQTIQRLKVMGLHYSTTVECYKKKCGHQLKPEVTKQQKQKLQRLRKNVIREVAKEVEGEVSNKQVLELLRQIG